MHTFSYCIFFLRKRIWQVLIFLLLVFFASCSKDERTVSLDCSQEEKERIESFLNELLFEEGGAYTLLGDKPITSLLIFSGNPSDVSIENLSESSFQNIQYVEYYTADNWRLWKKHIDKLVLKKFRFIEFECPLDPSYTYVLFVNVEKTMEVIKNRWNVFKQRGQIPFESKQGFQDIDTLPLAVWKKVLTDHYLSGLLYGYGEENISYFLKGDDEKVFSECFEGNISCEDFPIPIYASVKGDQVSKEYIKQRAEIKKIFQGKDFVEVTLKKLTS